MSEEEQVLSGGNVSEVIKIGKTVHRQTNFWSKSVHDLLLYLEEKGFDYSPRFLGLDDEGREVLSFIDGVVGNDPVKRYMRSDKVIVAVAKIMREFHDITENFVRESDVWQMEHHDKKKHEVICHNDFATYNMVFENEIPVGIIDFDTCGPGPRIKDIAYTIYTFIPLASYWEDEDGSWVQYEIEKHRQLRKEKIDLFCNAYGRDYAKDVLPAVIERLEVLCDFIKEHADENDEVYIKMIDEGHVGHYFRQIEFLKEEGASWF